MKTRHTPQALILLALITAAAHADAPQINVYFSPAGGAAAALCQAIDSAKTSVWIEAYAISHPTITESIIAAHRRGLDVRVIVNPTQKSSKVSTATALSTAGVATFTDPVEKTAHNKVAIIDALTVATGSFNYTKSADTRNAENLIFITDKTTAATYAADFTKHYRHSVPLRVTAQPKQQTVPPTRKDHDTWHAQPAR